MSSRIDKDPKYRRYFIDYISAINSTHIDVYFKNIA
jgi:hypothetical protein